MKLYIGLVFSLFALAINGSSLGMESEFRKMACALRASQSRTGGFEGCKNQKDCGFHGYYLCAYSPEGLCRDCEFKQFPQRFVACVFCRQPTPKYNEKVTSGSCLGCTAKIQELLVKKINSSGKWNPSFTQGAHRAMSAADYTISREYIPALKEFATREQVFSWNPKTPLIYRGCIQISAHRKLHVWIKDFVFDEKDIREITWDDCGNYFTAICEKYNIFGPETGDVTLDRIPENTVATYEGHC